MKPVILIIEDEPAIAENIQYALATDGFNTRHIASGLPALELLVTQHIDLIILDIGLPDINGLDLCREIRKKHSLPIIFLTAKSAEIDRVVGLEIGADDYVVKPFSPRELSARVRAVLRRIRLTDTPDDQSQAFKIDHSKRKITFLKKILELSRYEFNLLKTFVQRPGHVFSRDQLMELAWDDPNASMDRTVDAHIKNIRAKLMLKFQFQCFACSAQNYAV